MSFRIIARFSQALLGIKALLRLGLSFDQLLQIKAAEYRQELTKNERYKDPRRLIHYEKQVFSQNGEDGIIAEIFQRIGVKSKIFVEIGVGNGDENNTVYLLFQGWHGFWVEADRKSIKRIYKRIHRPIVEGLLNLIHTRVTAENVSELLHQANVPDEFDLLSLDVDLNTYWIWEAMPAFKPRVVVVEYNAMIPAHVDWNVNYHADKLWDGTAYFGASLKSFELLGRKLGYNLVGCDLTGVNAFFIRKDLCGDAFESPFTAENHYEPARYFLRHNRSKYIPGFGMSG